MIKFLYFLLLFFPFISLTRDALSEYSKKANAIIEKKNLKKSHLGLSISLLPSNVEEEEARLFGLNEDQLFIPASLVKITSLSAFYHYFPLDFRFHTRLLSSSPVSEGQLEGNLIIKGGGDPGFTSEHLWNLVNSFKRNNITTIKGDILVDDSLYKPTEFKVPSNRSYYAVPNSASFNWNSATFWIRANKIGTQVFVDPENSYIKILNKIKLGKKTSIQIQNGDSSESSETFKFQGHFKASDEEKVFYRNIQNPPLWLGYNLLHFLKQQGITVEGTVKLGNCSSPCRILSQWESRPLPWHTYNMMKFSNNFVSRMLTTHLPLLKGEKTGDFQKGIQLIKDYLSTKIGLKNFQFSEPTGLARENRFSPKDIKAILLKDLTRFFNPEIMVSYPLATGIGTLKTRFKELSKNEFVRAKTGSISGVLGLAGFAQNSFNEKFVFVFIYNGPNKNIEKAQDLFDDMIKALFQ